MEPIMIEAKNLDRSPPTATSTAPASACVDVHGLLATHQKIADVWSVLDVRAVRPDLSDIQAWNVLMAVRRGYDPAVGINWDVLRHHADVLFGAASESSDVEA
jgi:hypothetical protein